MSSIPGASVTTLDRRRFLRAGGAVVGAAAVPLVAIGATQAVARSRRAAQEFAFDNTRGHSFTAQLVDGGLQLPGETQTYSGADGEANGDPALTRLDTSGHILGTIYLRGSHNVRTANSDGTYTGGGDRPARFEFANGGPLPRGRCTGSVVEQPEGMASQVPGPADPQAVRLCSGSASYTSDTDQSERASIHYKDVLVRPRARLPG
ncbi:hypothetical protein ACWC0C_32875 [Streptomyces sp. NPDC001709]